MYAVIRSGGKQYRVVADDVIKVEKLTGEEGELLKLDDVLMLGGDGNTQIGKDAVGSAAVFAEVLAQGKGEKILVFKKRRRKNSRRLNGHRQFETVLRVLSVSQDGTPPTERPAKKAKPVPVKADDEGEAEGEAKAAKKTPARKAPARKAAPKTKAATKKAAAGTAKPKTKTKE